MDCMGEPVRLKMIVETVAFRNKSKLAYIKLTTKLFRFIIYLVPKVLFKIDVALLSFFYANPRTTHPPIMNSPPIGVVGPKSFLGPTPRAKP